MASNILIDQVLTNFSQSSGMVWISISKKYSSLQSRDGRM